jgi:hypothetical protein
MDGNYRQDTVDVEPSYFNTVINDNLSVAGYHTRNPVREHISTLLPKRAT